MKKLKMILLLLVCCSSLSGCTHLPKIPKLPKLPKFTSGHYVSEEAKKYNKSVDAFFAAVDKKDMEAIKKLFAPNVVAADSDLEEELQQFFDFYQGPTTSCERDGQMVNGSYSSDHGVKTSTASSAFAVISHGVTYYCHFTLRYRDDTDKGNVGIQNVTLVSEKVMCVDGFKWPTEDGVHVIEDAPGDFMTRRIGGHPVIYTEIDRIITEQDILNFLKTSDNFKEFESKFGEANSETCKYTSYAYELPDVKGEKRYAKFLVDSDDDWRILEVYIENDIKQKALKTLWKSKDSD